MPQEARRVRSRLGSPRVKALAPEPIATDRLVLRRPKISDALAVFAYGSDPEVARYMDWPVLAHVDDAVRATEKALRGWESGDEFSWRITVKPDDTPIGAISCRITDNGADFGFVLARSRWGSGYATETARALLAWLTSLEEVRRIQATCDVDNTASAHVLEKLGMSKRDILPGWSVRPNLPGRPRRDAVRYLWTSAA